MHKKIHKNTKMQQKRKIQGRRIPSVNVISFSLLINHYEQCCVVDNFLVKSLFFFYFFFIIFSEYFLHQHTLFGTYIKVCKALWFIPRSEEFKWYQIISLGLGSIWKLTINFVLSPWFIFNGCIELFGEKLYFHIPSPLQSPQVMRE